MIAFNEPASPARRKKSPNPGQWKQLQITIEGSSPAIWRSVIIPADANLGWIHAVIQVSFGWTNSHLHLFRTINRTISDSSFDLDSVGELPVLDESETMLSDISWTVKSPLVYEYDLGDCWGHALKLTDAPAGSPGSPKMAVCAGGKRAGPPEDCGGIGGYEELVRTLKNKKHPEHQSMKQWLGRPFDPENFNPQHINRHLAKLKWPHVTEAALRKILMARDLGQ